MLVPQPTWLSDFSLVVFASYRRPKKMRRRPRRRPNRRPPRRRKEAAARPRRRSGRRERHATSWTTSSSSIRPLMTNSTRCVSQLSLFQGAFLNYFFFFAGSSGLQADHARRGVRATEDPRLSGPQGAERAAAERPHQAGGEAQRTAHLHQGNQGRRCGRRATSKMSRVTQAFNTRWWFASNCSSLFLLNLSGFLLVFCSQVCMVCWSHFKFHRFDSRRAKFVSIMRWNA